MSRLVFALLLVRAVPAPSSPLQVTALSVTPGAILTTPPTTLTITVNAPPDPTSVNSASVFLVRAGGDGVLGTADDLTVTPNSMNVSGNQIVLDFTGLTLPNDKYRLVVRGNDLSIPNMVNWWKLDEGSGPTAVDSVGGLNGTLGGGGGTLPTWTTGRLGGGLSFAGVDNRVSLGGTDLPIPFTAAMWVNRQNSSAVDARLMDSNFYSLRLEQFNGTKEVGVTVYGSVDTPFPYTAPIGQWVHLTFIGEANGTSLYVNGAFVKIVGTGISSPRNTLGSGGFNSMAGILDDVRIFNRRLTQNEITAVAGLGGSVRDASDNPLDGEFTGTFPSGDGVAGGDFVADFTITAPAPRITSMTPAPGSSVPAPSTISISSAQPLDPATVNAATVTVVRAGPDGILGTADDVAITPNSVSISGGSTIVVGLPGGLPADLYQVRVSGTNAVLPAPTNYWALDDGVGTTATDASGGLNGTLGGNSGTLPLWTSGKLGAGLSFEGHDNRVYMAGADLPAPWTTTLWVYRGVTVVEDARLMDSIAYSLRLEQYNFTRRVGVTIGGVTDVAFGYTAPIGQWTHLAFVGTSGGTSLYVNGIFSESVSTVLGAPRGNLGSEGFNSMVGILDEVRVYNSTLTPAQIQLLASLGGAVRSTGSIIIDGEFGGTFPSGDGVPGGDFVATFTVTAGAPLPPLAPTSLAAQSGDQQISLTWTASNGATGYNVKRATQSGTEVAVANGVMTTSFNDSGLTNGIPYYYVVTAVNPGGESPPSNEVVATPASPPGPARTDLVAGGCGMSGWEVLLTLLGLSWRKATRRGPARGTSKCLTAIFLLTTLSSLRAEEDQFGSPPATPQNAPSPHESDAKSGNEEVREKFPSQEKLPLPTMLAQDDSQSDQVLLSARGGVWFHPAFNANTPQGFRTINGEALADGGTDLIYQGEHWGVDLSLDYAAGRNIHIRTGGLSVRLVEALALEDLDLPPLFVGLSVGVLAGDLGVDLPEFGSFRSAWGFQARGEIILPLGLGRQISFWTDIRALSFRYKPTVLSGDTRAIGPSVALGLAITIWF